MSEIGNPIISTPADIKEVEGSFDDVDYDDGFPANHPVHFRDYKPPPSAPAGSYGR